jgi:FixJ family two-component response regulator
VALVITDVNMPLLGGAGLARILKQMRVDLPVLVISGLAPSAPKPADVEAAKNSTNAFLQKPFEAESLCGVVHQLIYSLSKSEKPTA